jgi:ketosteroid isomerase-like protein
MKTKILFLLLVPALFFALQGFLRAADASESSDVQQIKRIEHEWLQAIVHRDAAYLRKIEASDFTMIDPEGKLLSKDEDISNTTDGEMRYDDIALKDLKVRFYGDTAVATGTGEVKAHSKKESVTGRYLWTDVFVRTNGEWKAVSAQVTAVAPDKK